MFILGILVATIPPLFFGQNWYPFIYRGLVVFVVSCSCGLAISVPMTVVAGMANVARNGTIFKGGNYLEVVDKVKVMAFDKTGTLTIGRPEVTDLICLNSISEVELLSLAGAIESKSGHPIAAAIVRKAKESDSFSDSLIVRDFEEKSGFGLQATIDKYRYVIGNPRFQQELGVAIEEVQEDIAVEAGDVVLMSDDLGKIAYLRDLSRRVIKTIKQNIVVSLVNVAFMIIMAVMGYLGLVMGLLLNEASAVFVIFNAIRLLTWKNKKALES